jgi:hypothetical protein
MVRARSVDGVWQSKGVPILRLGDHTDQKASQVPRAEVAIRSRTVVRR